MNFTEYISSLYDSIPKSFIEPVIRENKIFLNELNEF
jgi:hypothetical protein